MLPPLLDARSEPERRGLLAEPRSRNSGMRVPWVRFHKTYEEYLRWEALALWARAIVETEGSGPSWLVATLKKRSR